MITNEPGFYDTYDADSDIFGVRARAGYVEQAREDNEIQSIQDRKLRDFGNTLYKNGALITGGTYGPGPTTSQLRMAESTMWWNGIILKVKEKDITLVGTGTETVGVKVTYSIVTASDDPGLLDPSTGHANEGQPGANRTKIVAEWVVGPTADVNFFTFLAGELQAQPRVGDVDIVTQALARRTYDTSGNYSVNGFDVTVSPLNENQVNVVVGAGHTGVGGSKAYVMGNEIIKIAPEKFPIDKAKDERIVQDERFYFDGSVDLFELASQPAASIDKLSATFDVIRTVTNHNFNNYDELIEQGETLIDVLRVYKTGTPSAPGTPYAKAPNAAGGGDFYKSGNGIRWDVTGSSSEPTAGDTYKVYCLVRKTVSADQYAITEQFGKSHLDVTDMVPKPYHTNLVDGSAQQSDMDVDYSFYLSRVDVVFLDAEGSIGVVEGQPEVRPVAPSASAGTLPLAQIHLVAGGEAAAARVTQYDNRRLTQQDLRKVLSRLERAEFNQATKDLQSEGVRRAGNSVSTLKGILVDSFAYTANDLETDGEGGVSKVKYVRSATTDNMLNIENRELTLPTREADYLLTPVTAGSTALPLDGAIVAPYVKGDALRAQVQATGTLQVNPYGDGEGRTYQELTIFPNGDSSAETDAVVLNTINPQNAAAFANSLQPNRATLATNPAALPNQTGFLVSETASLYLADQWIYVKGSGFTPGARLDVRMDNLAPREITTVAISAATATRPATRWAGLTRVLPACNVIGTGVGGVYPGASRVEVNPNGDFDFFLRTPLNEDGLPLRSGAKVVTVSSSAGDRASQVFSAQAIRQVSIETRDISEQVVQAIASLIPETAPRLKTVTVKNGADVALTDFTGTTTAKFDIEWDAVTGGTPSEVTVLLSNGTVLTKLATEMTAGELLANKITLTATGVTVAFEYDVYVSNSGGAGVPDKGVVTRDGLAPGLSKPGITGITFRGIAATCCHLDGVVASWTGVTGATKLRITVTGGKHPVRVTEVLNPAVNGSIALVGVSGTLKNMDVGNNTVRVEVIGLFGTTIINQTQAVPAAKDPVAQTFTVDADGFIDGIELFFSEKHDSTYPAHTDPAMRTAVPVRVELRTTFNGYPGGTSSTLLGAVATKNQADVVTSANATAGTYFKFPAPVFVKGRVQYAIVVTTDSDEYKVFYAKVNEPTIQSNGTLGAKLTNQAYLDGVLFTSSNNEAWTAQQDADLKFNLHEATFTVGEHVMNFSPILGTNMVGVYLPIDVMLPGSLGAVTPPCRVRWQYRLDGTGDWISVTEDTYEFFSKVAAASVHVRAFLRTTSAKLTPVIARNADLKVLRLYRDLAGRYVTKTATYDPYRYARMIAQMDIPTGGSVRWFVSDNTPAPGTVPAWSSATTYAKGNVVTNDSLTWLATGPSNNSEPGPLNASWSLVAVADGVCWFELPALGEKKTLLSDGVFFEHERTIDLGEDAGREQFRFAIDVGCNSVANSVKTARVRNVITITNE